MKTRDYQKDSVLSILLSFVKPHRGLFILDIACIIAIAVVDLIYPYISRYALNELLPKQAFKAFFIVMGILIGAQVLRGILNFIVTYYGHIFGSKVENDIRRELFGHMQHLGFDFYDVNRTGSLMSRLTNDLFDITELAHHGPENLLSSTLTMVGSLIMIYFIQWRLALVLTAALPLFVFIVVSRRKHFRSASAKVKEKIAVINSDIESTLSGMKTAQAFANEEVEMEKFIAANSSYQKARRDHFSQLAIFNGLSRFSTSVISVLVILTGGYLIMKDQMTLVDLLTFTLYVSSFTAPINQLSSLVEQISVGSAGLNRFVQLMRIDSTIKDKEEPLILERIDGEIELDQVHFAYKPEQPILKGISLKVHKNETIALVGPSGQGKTTLISLLPRFYDVSEGVIRVDGHDIRDLKLADLRKQIGIVQQDVFLFADTIGHNIAYGKPGASEEEIIEAAKKAEIYDDIMAMPEGLDTFVGERGTRLSGGQKQRIAIARIFLKNPPILILDEATSALDTLTESRIQSAFDALAKGRTTLIIAHRLSTTRKANRIIVVNEGRIEEQGSHQQLMENNGLYARLYNTQTRLHG